MVRTGRMVRRAGAASVLGVMLVLQGTAAGQDCALSVGVFPQIVSTGQKTSVDVVAHFPPTSYAFASADLDILANSPQWTSVSAGAVVGTNVLNIQASQQHLPGAGVWANPANPKHIWTGTLAPMVDGPALVEVRAEPQEFWYYPNKLTPSSVGCQARPGRAQIFVDPLPVGKWRAAPGENTRINVVDDVIVDGRIIAAPLGIHLGLILAPEHQGRSMSTSVFLSGEPVTFVATVQLQTMMLDGSVRSSRHGGGANFCFADGHVKWSRPQGTGHFVVEATLPTEGPVAFEGFLGGVVVATGEVSSGQPMFLIDAVPEVIEATSGRVDAADYVLWRTNFGQTASMRLPNGLAIPVDRVEMVGRVSSNNLKQMTLGAFNIEATGVDRVILKPRQP